MTDSYIEKNIMDVKKRIEIAARKAGRKPEDIILVGVTKTIGIDKINAAIAAGITDLGENRVQELCDKYDYIDKSVKWHLIGHLQKNKVKYVVDKAALIHSLDSIELAQEIQKRAQKTGKEIDVLVQVNIAREETKFGIKADECIEFIKTVSLYKNIRVKGLMTIAPFTEQPESVRWVFKELNNLRIDILRENIDNINMDYLSMGMSNDFEVAIEEGANIVRIGTSIFGKRLQTNDKEE